MRFHKELEFLMALVSPLLELTSNEVRPIVESPRTKRKLLLRWPHVEAAFANDVMTERPNLVSGIQESAESQALRGLRVLVVDDHEDTRSMMSEFLTWHGAHPVAASEVSEALHVLETASVDIVVTDIAMPRDDGYALLRQMDANPRWEHIPRIIASGEGFADDFPEQAKGVIRLSKPVALDELIRALRKVYARALMDRVVSARRSRQVS